MSEPAQKPHYNKILSDRIVDQIAAALGIEISAARRIILDVEIGKPVRVYIEFYGDTRMQDLDLPEMRDGVDFSLIRIASGHEPPNG
jgi:hypothetical protein